MLSPTFSRTYLDATFFRPKPANSEHRAQIQSFVESLFNLNTDISKFKLLLRDFLIQLKEFSGDNAELFAEDREDALQAANAAERAEKSKVGGLLKPADLDQDDEL